jgi:hypothetical protein
MALFVGSFSRGLAITNRWHTVKTLAAHRYLHNCQSAVPDGQLTVNPMIADIMGVGLCVYKYLGIVDGVADK